ncbi:hypothetical protein DdX_18809 [Ditylenchus destructor]|uniref:Uncharacterized protein n=1 Tax=Ditylenchus destructor TaxID=166010 RepID=A0AAD4MKI0_9BILA|nr:hypothetical protein DdX_18809 [Ditylenchus destructor]
MEYHPRMNCQRRMQQQTSTNGRRVFVRAPQATRPPQVTRIVYVQQSPSSSALPPRRSTPAFIVDHEYLAPSPPKLPRQQKIVYRPVCYEDRNIVYAMSPGEEYSEPYVARRVSLSREQRSVPYRVPRKRSILSNYLTNNSPVLKILEQPVDVRTPLFGVPNADGTVDDYKDQVGWQHLNYGDISFDGKLTSEEEQENVIPDLNGTQMEFLPEAKEGTDDFSIPSQPTVEQREPRELDMEAIFGEIPPGKWIGHNWDDLYNVMCSDGFNLN